MKSKRLYSSVVLVALSVLLAVIPASAGSGTTVNSFTLGACGQSYLWYEDALTYNVNTVVQNSLGAVSFTGTAYKSGQYAAFSSTLVKPTSGANIYWTSISGLGLAINSGGAFYVYNGGANDTAEIQLSVVQNMLEVGRCLHP